MPRPTPRHWHQRGLLAWALAPLALLFLGVAALRRRAYRLGWLRVEVLPVPVVVVGNIAVGGSGKTPVVLWLVDVLRRAGFHPGIISRGYGGQVAGVALVPAGGDPAQFGDEPVLLANMARCPVAVGADRPAAGRLLLATYPECDVLVSDDGLQHYRLGRSLELVVVDQAVLGNRQPLPAGPLREGLGRLGQADLVIAHGPLAPDVVAAAGHTPRAPMELVGTEFLSLAEPSRHCPPEAFAGRPVHGVAGIGRPERFFQQLEKMGLAVIPHPFPDHHPFTPDDLAFAPGEAKILTTKDGVKCAPFATPEMWVFPVTAQISGNAEQIIVEKLRHGSPTA